MTKTTTKVHTAQVDMCDDIRKHLLACYRNHLVVYNDLIDLNRKNRYRTYREMKIALARLLEERNPSPIIKSALANEVYYLFKKADFKHKLITDIQYISAITDTNYKNHTLVYDAVNLTLSIPGTELTMRLSSALPVVTDCVSLYLNLSYSCGEDLFEISVFTTTESHAEVTAPVSTF